MEYNSLSDLKSLYDDGFKCIRYERDDNDDMIIYLKNFEKERIEELVVTDADEIKDIVEFLNY